jgi:hypothetical protein
MSPRAAARLAWSLAGLSVAIFVASIVLSILAPSAQSPSNWGAVGMVSDMLVFVSFLAFPLVGALVASRLPRNPIGWICLVAGLFWMLIILSEGYSAYGLARGGRGCVGSSGLIKPLSVARRAWSWWWLLSGTASRKG